MLLRWFLNLYDLEVIEEEAFLKWREDISDAYPGKGKALFQVSHTRFMISINMSVNFISNVICKSFDMLHLNLIVIFLFNQVNSWLTWLAEASSEEEEGDA